MTQISRELSRQAIKVSPSNKSMNLFRWMWMVLLIFLMLAAVSMIGSGFKQVTAEHARSLFEFASNPVMGLVIGMAATALIQSSSTVTSIIVGMVAGGLPITIAVPMMMGANIGTSITNTIVSLGHVANKSEFQRAFNAATIHDFFNLFAVMIFLPLEIMFGLLEYLSGAMVSLFSIGSTSAINGINPIEAIITPFIAPVDYMVSLLPGIYPGIAMIFVGIGLIILSITFMGKIIKVLMVGRAKEILHKSIGRGPITGIFSGTVVTVLVQSSSTTTSLMVPLVGNGILSARSIYPFTLGANIGTCITALIAALSITGLNAEAALQIALVHLIYNVLAVSFIFGIGFLRELPLTLSYKLSQCVAARKELGVAYIAGLFFLFPLSIIFFTT